MKNEKWVTLLVKLSFKKTRKEKQKKISRIRKNRPGPTFTFRDRNECLFPKSDIVIIPYNPIVTEKSKIFQALIISI